jgi:flagellar biosynthesis protein FlhB
MYHNFDVFVKIHRWEDNIKMDLQEVGGGHGD